jgi:GH24 family phage-related lysozyme (muramidase)
MPVAGGDRPNAIDINGLEVTTAVTGATVGAVSAGFTVAQRARAHGATRQADLPEARPRVDRRQRRSAPPTRLPAPTSATPRVSRWPRRTGLLS